MHKQIYLLTPVRHGVRPVWEDFAQVIDGLSPPLKEFAASLGITEPIARQLSAQRNPVRQPAVCLAFPPLSCVAHDRQMCHVHASSAAREVFGFEGPNGPSCQAPHVDLSANMEVTNTHLVLSQPPSASTRLAARLLAALILHDLLREVHLVKLTATYGQPAGIIQSLHSQASTFQRMVAAFCKNLNWDGLHRVLKAVSKPLQHGAKVCGQNNVGAQAIPCVLPVLIL